MPTFEDDPPVGSSRFGGNPDLPIGIPWPTWHGKALDFLLQLDVAEISRHLAGHLLPERGWIYFSCHIESKTWGYDVSGRGSWRVLFFEGDRKNLMRRVRPDSGDAKLRLCTLTFYEGIYVDWFPLQGEVSKADRDYLCQIEDLLGDETEILGHQILGHTESCHSSHKEMQRQCELASNGVNRGDGSGPAFVESKAKKLESGVEDWRLLLELRSDKNADLLWDECGALYFWIREEDLRNCDFHNVWALYHSL
jgi:uncharacterized protein YwqG